MTPGVLVLDKPQGPTSHDMVAVARRALGERRIGHCGTLDPMATGVLALAVGPATRLVQFLASAEKQYHAGIRFGRTTNTYDATGETTSSSIERPTLEELAEALGGFRGTFAQVPPAFSAKKVGGHRAYDLARRQGHPPPLLEPVSVTVSSLELLSFDGDAAVLAMEVSAGFYVRSLAHDLGQRLGMGAVLESLRRTRSGAFRVEDAVSVAALTGGNRDELARRMIPLEQLLLDRPALRLDPATAERARRGVDVPCPPEWAGRAPLTRLLEADGRLLGLASPAPRPGFLHPFVVLG